MPGFGRTLNRRSPLHSARGVKLITSEDVAPGDGIPAAGEPNASANIAVTPPVLMILRASKIEAARRKEAARVDTSSAARTLGAVCVSLAAAQTPLMRLLPARPVPERCSVREVARRKRLLPHVYVGMGTLVRNRTTVVLFTTTKSFQRAVGKLDAACCKGNGGRLWRPKAICHSCCKCGCESQHTDLLRARRGTAVFWAAWGFARRSFV